MHSNVQITLSSSDGQLQQVIRNLHVVGASLSYGINRLPVAHVQVDPKGLQTFCDFDFFRRRPISVTILTGGASYAPGCIQFDGMLDGVSLSQHPGGLSSTLIIKHNFTLLNELYPRILGLSAGSANMFSVQRTVSYDASHYGENSTRNQFLNEDMALYGYIAAANSISTKLALIPFIIEVVKIATAYQATVNMVQPDKLGIQINAALDEVIKGQQINKDKLWPLVESLLRRIDTSLTSKLVLKAQDTINPTSDVSLSSGGETLASKVINALTRLDDTIYSSMVRLVGEYGCSFVVSNRTAYVVPDAAYLQVRVNRDRIIGGRSTQPNIAYPGDYETFSFSDMGENTIKGVYVVPESVGSQAAWANHGLNVTNGCYIDPEPNTKGNIVVKTLPEVASAYVSRFASLGSAGTQQAIKTGNRLITRAVTTAELAASTEAHLVQCTKSTAQIQSFLRAWAQGEYCRIKYEDRTGSISMPFNNNWVPGAPGAAYTNHPGTWVHFLVTDVTHTFSLSAPNTGSATTNVSFKGGRPGKSIGSGLTTIPLYDYTYEASQDFCRWFLTDIKP